MLETMSNNWPGYFKKSFDDFTSVCSWDSLLLKDKIPFEYKISLLSVCSDELIDPAILSAVAISGFSAIEVVDLTDVDDISVKHSDVEMIQSTYKYSWSYLLHLTQNIDNSACVKGVEADFLAVRADMQQGQELAPKIFMKIKKQGHSILHALLTVVDDQVLVLSPVLVRTEEKLIYNPPAAVDPDDNQWAVKKLIKKRQIERAVKYLVKWLRYSESKNSWKRKKDIHPDIITVFEAELLLPQN